MQAPSRTALRVALRRAAHQVHDEHPLVFEDPLAERILPAAARAELDRTPAKDRRPHSASLRAFMVARARFAEDVLAASVARDVARQYVVLGAGLDTFACRNPFRGLHVFEVDHPQTQQWKRECLEQGGLALAPGSTLVAMDFERDALEEALRDAGFRFDQPAVVAWLGVVPYLTEEAFARTLRLLGALAQGSEAVFDYAYPRAHLPPVEQQMLDSMSARVAQAGEPFRLFFTREELRMRLEAAKLRMLENLGAAELNARFFDARRDGLRVLGRGAHLCHAVVDGPESARGV